MTIIQGDLYFSKDELALMQAHQAYHMMDTCTVDVCTDAGADAFGNPNPSWVASDPIKCGLRMTAPDEGALNADAPLMDAQLRLPIDTSISSKDRITITHRHGVPITPNETYMLIGEPKRGPSGLVCDLEIVTDGS